MSSDSMPDLEEATPNPTPHPFRQRVSTVKDFIPDVADGVHSAVGDWTGESRKACDEALKRMEKRGEELADLLTAAADAMEKILAEGQHAESKAFACIDS